MATKEEAWAAIYKNPLWAVPVRPSRWRNVLEAVGASGKRRQRQQENMNILDRARAGRSRK